MPVFFRGVSIIRGIRAGSEVIHFNDGFYYHKHNDRDRPTSWTIGLRCIKSRREHFKCRGRATVTRDGMHVQITQAHNHAPDFSVPQEKELRRTIVERVRRGDPTPFKIIIREEGQRGRYSMEVRSRLTINVLRSTLRNVRMLSYPNIPRNLPVLGAILHLPQYREITAALDGTDSIYAGVCGVFAHGTVSVVFMSRRMMHFLQRQAKVYADGTFKKRPRKPGCSQIFNLSCTWTNEATNSKHAIVVGRVLMQTRTEAAYDVLLQFLKRLMPAWEPLDIMCDFERGQINAWRSAFPMARVVPCLWHYAVAVFRHAKELGLHSLMQEHWAMDAIVRCLCSISLLPRFLLMQGLIVIGVWARRCGFMCIASVRSLFAYLYREFMSRHEYLSVCEAEDRTNNVSESINAGLGWELRKDHPNTYELLGTFVREEDQFMVDIHALRNGRDASRAQRVSTVYNDARICNLTNSLRNGYISVFQFLRSSSRTLQAPYDYVFARHPGQNDVHD